MPIESVTEPVASIGWRQVERRSHADYVKAGRPVVIKGSLASWKALSTWSLDYLRALVGEVRVPVEISATRFFPPLHTDPGYEFSQNSVEMTVAEYIDKAILGAPRPEKYYAAGLSIPEKLPALLADIEYPGRFAFKAHADTLLWFAAAETASPLHYDIADNWFAQVKGRKRFVLFAPGQTRRLYPFRLPRKYHFSQVDIEQPDLKKYPHFRRARALECVLEPGDVLFLPVFWWHQVYSLDTSVSVSVWSNASKIQYYLHPQALRLRYPNFVNWLSFRPRA